MHIAHTGVRVKDCYSSVRHKQLPQFHIVKLFLLAAIK